MYISYSNSTITRISCQRIHLTYNHILNFYNLCVRERRDAHVRILPIARTHTHRLATDYRFLFFKLSYQALITPPFSLFLLLLTHSLLIYSLNHSPLPSLSSPLSLQPFLSFFHLPPCPFSLPYPSLLLNFPHPFIPHFLFS